jgi:RibD C-terminal domain
MFDVGFEPWGDPPPFGMPVFIVTHEEREPMPMQGGTTYTFVTDGIEAALELARAAAGDKDVRIWGGANIIRQYLKAGFLDEMQIHLIPILSATASGSSRISTLRDRTKEDKHDRDTGRHPLPIRSGEVTHVIPYFSVASGFRPSPLRSISTNAGRCRSSWMPSKCTVALGPRDFRWRFPLFLIAFLRVTFDRRPVRLAAVEGIQGWSDST